MGIGGKGGGSGPKAPSAKAMSQAQMGANIGSAVLGNSMGMIGQSGPFGSLSYDQTGTQSYTDPYTGQTYEVPTYQANTSLSPQLQGVSNNLMGAAKDISGGLSGINFGALPQAGNVAALPQYQSYAKSAGLDTSAAQGGDIVSTLGNAGDITRSYGTDFSADRQRVEDALMQRMQGYLDKDRSAMDARLANQGIALGSEAYTNAQSDFGRNVNDARLSAILGAGQEQSRLTGLEAGRAAFENSAQQQAFNQGLGSAQFTNQAQQQAFGQDAANIAAQNAARQQEFANRNAGITGNNQNASNMFSAQSDRFGQQNTLRQNAMGEQMLPYQQLSGILGMNQSLNPNFGTFAPQGIATPDVAGMMAQEYQNDYGRYANQKQQQGGLFGNLIGAAGSLGSAAIMASDIRLKTDIERVGANGDLGIYNFRYLWDEPGTVRRGYMAQEVAQVKPEAVVDMGGYLAVDYAQLPRV